MKLLIMALRSVTPLATPIMQQTIKPISTTANSSPNLDLSISIAVIIALTALISPIIVALINNKHQYKMKKMEYEENEKAKLLEIQSEFKRHQWDTYYSKATVVYEELAKNVGMFLGDTSYIEPYSKSIASINQALVYADNDLQGDLRLLMADIIAFDENGSELTNVKANKGSALHALEKVITSANRMISIRD